MVGVLAVSAIASSGVSNSRLPSPAAAQPGGTACARNSSLRFTRHISRGNLLLDSRLIMELADAACRWICLPSDSVWRSMAPFRPYHCTSFSNFRKPPRCFSNSGCCGNVEPRDFTPKEDDHNAAIFRLGFRLCFSFVTAFAQPFLPAKHRSTRLLHVSLRQLLTAACLPG